MVEYEWLLLDLLNLIYNLTWLVVLTREHYGQVTTTAGHIFELNVLLTSTFNIIFIIIFLDLKILPLGIMAQILDTASHYNILMAMAGSLIETAVFLKTLNVNTMMTNTAGKIILVIMMVSYGLAVINTLALPSKIVQSSELYFCTQLTPRNFFRVTIPETVGIVLALSVMGFGVFRSLQIRRIRYVEESSDHLSPMEIGHETEGRSGVTPPQEKLMKEVISKLNQETQRETIEEDLVIEDIEFVDKETSSTNQVMIEKKTNSETDPNACSMSEIKGTDTPSQGTIISVKALTNLTETPRQSIATSPSTMDHDVVMIDEISQVKRTNPENNMRAIGMSENQQNPTGCVPGMNMNIILETIQKYMKNTMISLLILTTTLPLNLVSVYGFITNIGCENHTIKAIVEISEFGLYLWFFVLPLLIKLKLDRLSE